MLEKVVKLKAGGRLLAFGGYVYFGCDSSADGNKDPARRREVQSCEGGLQGGRVYVRKIVENRRSRCMLEGGWVGDVAPGG